MYDKCHLHVDHEFRGTRSESSFQNQAENNSIYVIIACHVQMHASAWDSVICPINLICVTACTQHILCVVANNFLS